MDRLQALSGGARGRRRLGRGTARRAPAGRKYVKVFLALLLCAVVCIWFGLLLRIWKDYAFVVPQHFREGFVPPASNEGDKPSWTIFYHIFIPPKSHKNALRIVHEQLAQIAQAVQQAKLDAPVTLYYTTVGDLLPELHEQTLPGCQSAYLQCKHWRHLADGSEAQTLQTVYDFCQQGGGGAATDHVVTYLHSKGSYHHHKVNERWRRHLTMAATHPDCLHQTQKQQQHAQCNVCGLQFYTQWTNFFPGNMWTARCDYVRQLLPPHDFGNHQEQAITDLLWLRHRGILASRLFADRLDRFGLDRYSTEHWIGSHPTLQPCDMAAAPLRDWLKEDKDMHDLSWALAPRHEGPPADPPSAQVMALFATNTTARREELFYLAGRLRLWYSLYHSLPPADSWVWSWFPDGDYWRSRSHESGDLLFLYDTEGYAPEGDLFAPLALTTTTTKLERVGLAMFWQIDTSDPDTSSLESRLHRIQSIQTSPDATVYYQVMGSYWEDYEAVMDQLAPAGSTMKALSSSTRLYAGQSLQNIYDYCHQMHPDDTLVALVSSTEEESFTLISQCVNAPPSATAVQNGQCNVCGGGLNTGPLMHFEKNQWVTSCSYIRKLLPPQDHIVAMNRVIAQVWVQQLTDRLRGVPESSACLGMDAAALQSWVSSHPSFRPCQVPPQVVAQHDCGGDGSSVISSSDKGARWRDYSLLAGHLFRWQALYQELPSSSSWIWQTFPDGALWREQVKRHGREVVEEVTRPWADTSV